MIKRLLALFAVIGFIWWVTMPPAISAPERPSHNPNVYSYWNCGATRLDDEDFVTHSVPTALTPDFLFSYCRATWFNGSHEKQWWAVMSTETGESAVWVPWRFCYLGEYCAPEP